MTTRKRSAGNENEAPSSLPRSPASILRSRSAHQPIAAPIEPGPQVLPVTDAAESRPSRSAWISFASGNSRMIVCASRTLCEDISTRPGLPRRAATPPSRSMYSARQAAIGSLP